MMTNLIAHPAASVRLDERITTQRENRPGAYYVLARLKLLFWQPPRKPPNLLIYWCTAVDEGDHYGFAITL